jgi:hypothetical protein
MANSKLMDYVLVTVTSRCAYALDNYLQDKSVISNNSNKHNKKKKEEKKIWPYCASTVIKSYLLKICVHMVSIHHIYMNSSILLISEMNLNDLVTRNIQVTRKTNWK